MPIVVDKVTYKYSPNTVYETTALDDVSLEINEGEFMAIIGHTGSGKSTLIQHLNGLIKATEGHIYFNGEDIYDKGFDFKELRTRVGMVFQYPEYQLFENTVFEDVKFGPKNQGLSDKDASLRAYEALDLVNFPKDLFGQAPFNLSGGQKRLAAIAGVLAMKPEIIILDEPASGLDPRGKKEIFDILKDMHERTGRGVVVVSHNMEDVAKYADRLVVMDKGQVLYDASTREVFTHVKELEEIGLCVPEVSYLMKDLMDSGINVPAGIIREEEAVEAIIAALGVEYA